MSLPLRCHGGATGRVVVLRCQQSGAGPFVSPMDRVRIVTRGMGSIEGGSRVRVGSSCVPVQPCPRASRSRTPDVPGPSRLPLWRAASAGARRSAQATAAIAEADEWFVDRGCMSHFFADFIINAHHEHGELKKLIKLLKGRPF